MESNITEMRVIPRPDLDLEDIEYFVSNGWHSHKSRYHSGYYVLVRRNAPVEDFQTYNKARDYDFDD